MYSSLALAVFTLIYGFWSYERVYVYVCVCMCVSVWVYVYIRMCVCTYVCMYVCIGEYMYDNLFCEHFWDRKSW